MRIAVGLGKKGGEERLAQQGVSRRDFLKFCTAVAVTMGAPLYFDETEGEITTEAGGNVPAGYAAADAEASAATVLVNIGDPNGAAAEVAAVHDSLALKDTSGKVYDITVSTEGALTATARE